MPRLTCFAGTMKVLLRIAASRSSDELLSFAAEGPFLAASRPLDEAGSFARGGLRCHGGKSS